MGGLTTLAAGGLLARFTYRVPPEYAFPTAVALGVVLGRPLKGVAREANEVIERRMAEIKEEAIRRGREFDRAFEEASNGRFAPDRPPHRR